ncbi:MAG: NAD(P)H-dependent oxidoreductase [Halofilum sp. (in: g-proteobacteria)]|nr:NAD(P)H-dependent oxidoreductase [Halofilum sp. (in: g-proteobacteria)]
MAQRILIVQGHPDPERGHFVPALAQAYAEGAGAAGHEVRIIEIGALEFPLVRSRVDWEADDVPADIATAQQSLLWADHLLLVYPLWLGTMPALLKGFLEQLLRPRFAFGEKPGRVGHPLRGRSARIVVTMGMPAPVYRWYFRAHSLKSLERNILHFCGIRPVRASVVGSVEGSATRRERWLRRMRELGARAR